MGQQSNYSCQEKAEPLKPTKGAAQTDRARATQDPIEQAYREQQQAFDRLLARYLELYRIADKRAHTY